ncbi:DUF2750 domain-containing protein [Paraferrimonas sp. SM1919]|uniref:DUF2750 domain-containing protein n=1 Tax=Paraferrimonas sp. SM1919 TaxID=2662263 RepID=UPI0013D3CD9A|nr:DUF2750 domain-containing protein [Paraferrimonas sp. SM1919]
MSINTQFINAVIDNQLLWGLAEKNGDGFLVCDSSEYEDTDVMPLWDSEQQAASHCTDEWSEYSPVSIDLEQFLEFWVSDLNDDGVLVGVQWQLDGECPEYDPIELAKAFAEQESD